MAKKIVWTDNALADLESVISYLLLAWNKKIAENFVNLAERKVFFVKSSTKAWEKNKKATVHFAGLPLPNIIY